MNCPITQLKCSVITVSIFCSVSNIAILDLRFDIYLNKVVGELIMCTIYSEDDIIIPVHIPYSDDDIIIPVHIPYSCLYTAFTNRHGNTHSVSIFLYSL